MLWRQKAQQIPVHLCPTNPKGCSSTAHGHPCRDTCPQPAQEEDLCKKTAADVWVGCGEAQRRDQEGSRPLTEQPCVILSNQTFHPSVPPFSPRETMKKLHPFTPWK